MSKIVRVHHDKHLDLVRDESGDEGALDGLSAAQKTKAQREDHALVGGEVLPSQGVYTVETGSGPQQRHKVEVAQPGHYTEVELPDDYAGTAQELTHLLDTLKDRMIGEHATGVSGTDKRLVGRLAALLDVEVLDQ